VLVAELLGDSVALLEELRHVASDLLTLLLEALELNLLLLLGLTSLGDEVGQLVDAILERAHNGVLGTAHVGGGLLELREAGLETLELLQEFELGLLLLQGHGLGLHVVLDLVHLTVDVLDGVDGLVAKFGDLLGAHGLHHLGVGCGGALAGFDLIPALGLVGLVLLNDLLVFTKLDLHVILAGLVFGLALGLGTDLRADTTLLGLQILNALFDQSDHLVEVIAIGLSGLGLLGVLGVNHCEKCLCLFVLSICVSKVISGS